MVAITANLPLFLVKKIVTSFLLEFRLCVFEV